MFKKKKKVKAEIDENGQVYFWKNDSDGFSEKDLMVILTSIVFFGGIGVGLLIIVLGMFLNFELPDKYIELLNVMDAPIGIILGGLFTVKTAQTIVQRRYDNPPDNASSNQTEYEEGSEP